ncbi:hypothetical protein, partial [Pseudacidovorax intermedius]|uniref:hypothetical protein n=1 Tax=Pseudacidovorax intermedius TaxID=433924 RepID=UPI001E300D26
LMVSGSMAYQSWYRPAYDYTAVDALDLTIPKPISADWKQFSGPLVVPRKPPLNTKVGCRLPGSSGVQ